MKKFLMSLSIIAICAMALDISILSVQNQRLKNKVADLNLLNALRDQSVEAARDTAREGLVTVNAAIQEIDRLHAEVRHSAVAVNEKQGAHKFVYVEADSWVDLANGEKVPAYKKIAAVRDIDAAPNSRWTATPGLNIHNLPIHYNGVAVEMKDMGTGGWNR